MARADMTYAAARNAAQNGDGATARYLERQAEGLDNKAYLDSLP